MILTDQEIAERFEELFPQHHEIMDRDVQLQPASVDMRLGTEFWIGRRMGVPAPANPIQDSAERFMMKKIFSVDNPFRLNPGAAGFTLASTSEVVHIPNDLVGRVDGRSSLGRWGVRVHSTAGFIDPGFTGCITLEIDLVGRFPLWLVPGMRICQISFSRTSGNLDRPYGEARGSKYIGEASRGAQLSLANKDKEWTKGLRNDASSTIRCSRSHRAG